MFEKIASRENFIRLITVLLIASIAILAFSILSDSTDGRRQIADLDGGSEEQLCSVLSGMKGVGAAETYALDCPVRIEGAGEVEVMVSYDSEDAVSGVIVIAEGGDDPVVASDLTRGVSTLFDIPLSNVIVFAREEEE